MDDTYQKSRRLTKRTREHNPPPAAYYNGIKRSPSDASYFNQQSLGPGRPHQPSAPSSTTTHGASPLLHRSPSLLAPVHEQHSAHSAYPASASPFAQLPPASVGAPFNAAVVEEALHASRPAPPRPAPPQHSYTADQPSKFRSPTLRQSASFTALARKMDTPPSGTKSPRSNRYSDEGDAAKKRNSGGGKKKGTFSSFMSNLVSSPRRPTISTPTNPMHVTHVSIDNETGEFTVRGTATAGPTMRLLPRAFPLCRAR